MTDTAGERVVERKKRIALAFDRRREVLTRLIAAHMMGLVDDPLGERLPTDIWTQAAGKADAVLLLLPRSS